MIALITRLVNFTIKPYTEFNEHTIFYGFAPNLNTIIA